MSSWLLLIVGASLLYGGARWFVDGASALALALRVPQLIVGLTVVAYGTSAPELIVGVQAALGGHSDVTLGNLLGSNAANIGLVLGVTALVRPPQVDASLRRRELPLLLLATLALFPLLFDARVSRVEGLALLACGAAYTAWAARTARSSTTNTTAPSEPAPKRAWRSCATALLGLLALLGGGHLFIDGAVQIAAALGMSERLVGLTVVALGTSLPEVLTSVVAARKGHSDLAVGAVVGSNIFNILLCLGAASALTPLAAPLSSIWPDLLGVSVATLAFSVFIRTERTMRRWEGAALLVLYGGLLAASVWRG